MGPSREARNHRFSQHRLDVDDRGSVDRFNRTNEQSGAVDFEHGDRMKSQRVWPVRRSSEEHARERVFRVAARMHLEGIASSLMQPRNHDQVVPNRDTQQPILRPGMDLEPGVGRAFVSLLGRLVTIGENRPNDPDGP